MLLIKDPMTLQKFLDEKEPKQNKSEGGEDGDRRGDDWWDDEGIQEAVV